MSSKTSMVFVLTEKGDKKIRGYYTLSSMSVKFEDLPKNVQRKVPRYPLIGATLLGRLGVDERYRDELSKRGEKPRLGELLLVDAQKNCLKGSSTVASAVMLIDVEQPNADEIAAGARDPMGFYLQYGFLALPKTPRTVFKRVSTIEKELAEAGITVTEIIKDEQSLEAKDQMPSDFKPEPTGSLKLGGLKTFNVNFVHDTRFKIPIPAEHHSFEELDALRNEGQWKDVVLSTIAVQLKTWTQPKVRTYSFVGKVIGAERGDGETLVTLDKYGDVKIADFDV